MKKYIVLIVAITIMVFSGYSQGSMGAIGLRSSAGNFGFGPELSYQHDLEEGRRAELGLGIGLHSKFDRFGFGGSYQLVNEVESGFSWFAGPAVNAWLYSLVPFIDENTLTASKSVFGASIGAQFGVEYDFNHDLDLPFTASVDSKPMYNFVNYYSGFEFAVGISIRYNF